MDSIEKVIEYNGFSPIYMMENYEELAKELHWNIYEDEDGDHYKFNTLFNGEIDLIDDDCNLYLMEVQND